MEVGIIGYRGFVGSAFYEEFSKGGNCKATGIDRANAHLMDGRRFDILINANGNSSKRLADTDPARDFEMNAIATLGFLRSMKCSHYVHLSTVEVYNDKSSQEGTREDGEIAPESLSNYGFSKYCGELLAKKYAKSYLILRLAGMVGRNMKKGPAYDILREGRLFLSEKSRLHFMRTGEVARIARLLCERGRWGQVYNVAGKGAIALSDFASLAGVRLTSVGSEEVRLGISTQKLLQECKVGTSEEEVRAFLGEWDGSA